MHLIYDVTIRIRTILSIPDIIDALSRVEVPKPGTKRTYHKFIESN